MKAFLICGLLVFAVFVFFAKPVEAIPADQNVAMIKTWTLPTPGGGDYSLSSTFSGNDVFFAGSNTIGQLDTTSDTIIEWDSAADSHPTSITYHPSGDVYFLENNGVAKLNPVTNTITHWAINSSSPVGNNSLSVDPSSDNVYFIENNNIARLDPQTNTLTEYAIGANNSSVGFDSVNVDPSNGNVYFIQSNSNNIGRLDPQTGTITQWTIKSNSTSINSITLGFTGSNDIYFTDIGAEKSIGQLDMESNTITKWNTGANSHPSFIEFDGSTGMIYFVDSDNLVRLIPVTGEFTHWKLPEKPSSIEIDSAGSIHYINANGSAIVRLD